MESQKLKMSFDPHTIEHLGIKMYSVLPNAIAELIANAYDAEARTVHVKLYNDNGKKRIAVIDDGVGMSFDEINNNFLRIGRKRRTDDYGLSPNGKQKSNNDRPKSNHQGVRKRDSSARNRAEARSQPHIHPHI